MTPLSHRAADDTAATRTRPEQSDASDESPLGGVPDEWPTVAVVVLTRENYEEASDCLDSLETVQYPNCTVVVVDNGSEDGSFERLEREYEWCTFVRNEENLGVTGGNNVGIERALERGVDYVCLLNDDTLVTETFLAPLVETAERAGDAAIVGGLNYHASTGEVHNAGAGFSTRLGGRTLLYDEPRADDPYPVDYVPTCLALVDAEFLEQHGPLDESYFLGMEDVDLAWRAREAGKRVLVTPESAIYHRLGTTSTRSPFSIYHRVRNRLQFASEHLDGRSKLTFLAVFLCWTGASLLLWSARRDWRRVRAGVLGGIDHHRGRPFRAHHELV